MKKLILGICLLAGFALASCSSHTATNAADGNNAMLDSSKKMQDSTAAKPDSSNKVMATGTKPDTVGKSNGAGTGPSNGVNQSKSDSPHKK